MLVSILDFQESRSGPRSATDTIRGSLPRFVRVPGAGVASTATTMSSDEFIARDRCGHRGPFRDGAAELRRLALDRNIAALSRISAMGRISTTSVANAHACAAADQKQPGCNFCAPLRRACHPHAGAGGHGGATHAANVSVRAVLQIRPRQGSYPSRRPADRLPAVPRQEHLHPPQGHAVRIALPAFPSSQRAGVHTHPPGGLPRYTLGQSETDL
jgi:hypothetical protein